MSIDILQVAGSLGVGAFLGLIIFCMYRSDRKSSEERFIQLLQADQQTRKENTEVLAGLKAVIENINKNGYHNR